MKRIRRFFKPRRKMRRVKVFALVGETGTGKSFRAKLLTEKRGIDMIIDDGLLIRDQRILAGRSAKREKNRITAIKRAVFDDPDHAREVHEVLNKEKFRSILVLGTSEKMIGRVVERLGLPYPDEVIYIQDIATRDEIASARDSRRMRGKHVIPVPVIEVKEDPGHRILDTIRFLVARHPYLFWKKRMVEKTVVQPAYSRKGVLSISENALGQMVMHCIQEYEPSIRIRKITIEPKMNGHELDVDVSVPYGIKLPDIMAGLHQYIIANIERYSGIHFEKLDLHVSELQESDEDPIQRKTPAGKSAE